LSAYRASFRIGLRHDMMEVQGAIMLRKLFCGLLPLASLFVTMAVLLPSAWAQNSSAPPSAPADLSGMFTFLREGEFVQLTVEGGQLSGFVSRFGDTESDKGEFIDHFFDKASLQGDRLSFKTKAVHAVWYEFDGTLTTAAGKQKGEEGYQILRGKLTMHRTDATGKDQASERAVEFESFPDASHMRK
jgi:hypothetical protein